MVPLSMGVGSIAPFSASGELPSDSFSNGGVQNIDAG